MNPDMSAFLASFNTEMVFGQVVVMRLERGFEVRHESDRGAATVNLTTLNGTELRDWAQTAAGGAFRPLRSAPNLRPGWRALAADGESLELLLHYVYPGAVADWFAAQDSQPPITSYRQFTSRQSGMYRITTMLDNAIAGAAIRACCHVDFCLKRRLWSVEGLEPDAGQCKSDIPCLEPCALLLEFARKVARLEQNAVPSSEEPQAEAAESDFNAPNNPRRVKFGLEKQALAAKPTVH
jgi:4Fe-4S binding protein/cobalt chelatase family protein